MNALNYIEKHKTCADSIMHLDLDLANNNISQKIHNKISNEITQIFINLHNYTKNDNN